MSNLPCTDYSMSFSYGKGGTHYACDPEDVTHWLMESEAFGFVYMMSRGGHRELPKRTAFVGK